MVTSQVMKTRLFMKPNISFVLLDRTNGSGTRLIG